MFESENPLERSPVEVAFDWHTDTGKRRQNNEDAARCDVLISGSGQVSTLLTLSDGVGGANAGEVASQMAVDGMQELIELEWRNQEEGDAEAPDHKLAEAMSEVDRRIRELGAARDSADMAATLSVTWIIGATAWWGHAGDSRIYLFREGLLLQITEDHSPVGRLRAEGALSEAEARAHPLRNLIDRCLGGRGEPVQPSTGHFDLLDKDVILLCSDGLVDGLWEKDMVRGLQRILEGVDLRGSAYELVEEAKNASGRDNITAIVARVGRAPISDHRPESRS